MSDVSDSPLSRAEDAKHNRDLALEAGILMETNADLESQPWYPLQVGDVVLMSTADGIIGETYVAERDEFDYDGPELALRRVSVAAVDGTPKGWSIAFYDLWFEAEPGTLVVIRAGRIVFGQPLYVAMPTKGDEN